MINKLIKFLLMSIYRLILIVTVYGLCLILTSPILCIVYSVFDLLCIGYLLTGKFLIVWLIGGAVLFVPVYSYVEWKAHRFRKPQAELSEQQE